MNGPTVQDVWALVPRVKCKGLCTAECSAIGMTVTEHAILSERMPDGHYPTVVEATEAILEDPLYRCPLLVDGQCSEYEVRPLVCRLYGATEGLPCPHGCKTYPATLTHAEGSELMQMMFEIGGDAV